MWYLVEKGGIAVGAAQNLSNNLCTIRALKQMSLVRFSTELGISKSTLQEIERGHSPSLDTLECIACRLDIPAAALISDSLAPQQTGMLLRLLQGFDWYRSWPEETQSRFCELFTQLLRLLEECKDQSPPPPLSFIP